MSNLHLRHLHLCVMNFYARFGALSIVFEHRVFTATFADYSPVILPTKLRYLRFAQTRRALTTEMPPQLRRPLGPFEVISRTVLCRHIPQRAFRHNFVARALDDAETWRIYAGCKVARLDRKAKRR